MKKMNSDGFGRLAAVALACAGLAARADLLYWTVSQATDVTREDTPKVEFSYATVSADGGATHLDIYGQSGDTGFWKLYANEDDASSTGAAYAGSFDADGVSGFLVELWDDAGARVAWQTYSLAGALDAIWRSDAPGGAGASPLTVHEVVPEPASGLLLLAGGALLALRRRRRG